MTEFLNFSILVFHYHFRFTVLDSSHFACRIEEKRRSKATKSDCKINIEIIIKYPKIK